MTTLFGVVTSTVLGRLVAHNGTDRETDGRTKRDAHTSADILRHGAQQHSESSAHGQPKGGFISHFIVLCRGLHKHHHGHGRRLRGRDG